jgi:predicted nucleic acid-binding protein
MSGERFTLDTNILVYALDTAAGAKHRLAALIVDQAVERDCHLTLQALSEFYAAVTRKGIVPKVEAAAQVQDWLLLFPALSSSATAVLAALTHAVAGRASYWDALLVATASEGGCVICLSEDMSDGGRLGTMQIVNPFDGDQLSAQAAELLAPGASAMTP